MFLRSTRRKKDGKVHRHFSVVENRRLAAGGTAQRTVLYLGEINDKQEEAWRKSLTIFDQDRSQYTTMSLFPDDHAIPAGVTNGVQVRVRDDDSAFGQQTFNITEAHTETVIDPHGIGF